MAGKKRAKPGQGLGLSLAGNESCQGSVLGESQGKDGIGVAGHESCQAGRGRWGEVGGGRAMWDDVGQGGATQNWMVWGLQGRKDARIGQGRGSRRKRDESGGGMKGMVRNWKERWDNVGKGEER